VTDKLRQFVRLTRKFAGLEGLRFLQEQIGEWGAAIAANAVGLESSKLKLHVPQGIDQLRRHTSGNFWAIIEAKGGTSSLGGTDYGKEMSPKWVRHWLNDTLDRNVGHPERAALLQAKNHPLANPMMVAVVRVNAERKTWQVKITVQKMTWNTPTLNWSGA
jgi:hypothetical protein